jgi:hypothetical protein
MSMPLIYQGTCLSLEKIAVKIRAILRLSPELSSRLL